MTANGKIQITINSSYTDGEFLRFTDEYLQQNRVVIADAIVRTIDCSSLSLLELRIVVPSEHADELLVGMVTGETEIAIGKMSPVIDPD